MIGMSGRPSIIVYKEILIPNLLCCQIGIFQILFTFVYLNRGFQIMHVQIVHGPFKDATQHKNW